MEHAFGSLDAAHLLGLMFALLLALAFECANGFHDTANAVATVIYTRSLPPWVAVVWSGLCNLAGVLLSTGTVAFGVITLLPVDLVTHVGSAAGFAMIFSLLLSAIIWNFGTWYLGLPASSSHTLIGSIMGVGLMHSLLTSGDILGGVNWAQARNVGMALLISPLVGFLCTAGLFLVIKFFVRQPELYTAPDSQKAPPLWIRGILCLTCTGVSLAHGSNDGQKGMGLFMLILVGIVPSVYALDLSARQESLGQLAAMSQVAAATLRQDSGAAPSPSTNAGQTLTAYLKGDGVFAPNILPALAEKASAVALTVTNHGSLRELSEPQRESLRNSVYLTSETIGKLNKTHKLPPAQSAALIKYKSALDKLTKFIPIWVKCAVALALGLGTMIGWKRIVVTVGEKIGKSHLTYAQGASAEMIAMLTIGLADRFGLPVSTTHVLSSGVAGSMAANRSGLQMATLRNVLLAWVLTLPVSVFLGAVFFAAGLRLMAQVFGLH